MRNILDIIEVSKQYNNFTLDKVSFSCYEGSIMGLIGPNGAGKSTIINAISGIIHLDGGNIKIFGKNNSNLSKTERENLAVVYDENCLPEHLTINEINKIFKNIFLNWDSNAFFNYIDRLDIPSKTVIKDMSKGNKVKLNLTVALAHDPKLLILDEVTGALDPIIREEVTKILLEFIQDEHKSILFSSHITKELEKISDYITFINNGKIIFSKEKDDLMYSKRSIK